jgi:Xaa-Pro aminopeptidase
MRYQKTRLEALQARMKVAGLEAALIGPSADMEYLLGGRLPPTERLNLLVVPQSGRPWLILPSLQAPLAHSLREELEIVIWQENDSPLDLTAQVLNKAGARTIGVDSHMWASFLLGLQSRLVEARFSSVSPLISTGRICKDENEIALLDEAGKRFDSIWKEFFETGRLTGQSEHEIAAQIRELTMAHGFDAMLWCDVGSGPNGASPLHHGSDRRVASGDPVVIDFAATYKGYVMDTCRTPVAGTPHQEFVAIYDTVNRAYDAGLAAVRPGVPAEQVDQAARTVIEEAGFGPQFLHRLGHGLGIDAHEEPYIVRDNATALRPGMVFSNEPGIYIAGRWGVRIENIVVVTQDGGRSLNNMTRELVSMQ